MLAGWKVQQELYLTVVDAFVLRSATAMKRPPPSQLCAGVLGLDTSWELEAPRGHGRPVHVPSACRHHLMEGEEGDHNAV